MTIQGEQIFQKPTQMFFQKSQTYKKSGPIKVGRAGQIFGCFRESGRTRSRKTLPLVLKIGTKAVIKRLKEAKTTS